MRQILSVYKVTLHTLAPVFIGSGLTYSKKDYLLRQSRGRRLILIPDLRRFYAFICEHGQEREYERFMLDPEGRDLSAWLKETGLAAGDNAPWVRYVLTLNDSEAKLQNIDAFIKNGRFEPYIPGSSLKGLLRSALFCYVMSSRHPLKGAELKSMQQAGRVSNKTRFLESERQRLEQEAFHTLNIPGTDPHDAVNSVLSGLSVSDSEPFSLKDLVLAHSEELFLNGVKKPLNLYKEALKANARVTFTLTLDHDKCPFSIEDLKNAVNFLGKLCWDRFYSKFKGLSPVAADSGICWLGGRTGFASTTAVHALMDEREALTFINNVFKQTLSDKIYNLHHHQNDQQLGIAPHVCRCTTVGGRTADMGRCRITFSEVQTGL